MNKADICLINPPFGMPDKPPLSLPVLGGYLKQKGFTVHALDFNNLFYHLFLAPEKLSAARAHIEERFECLNEKERLDALESQEYLTLFKLLSDVLPHFDSIQTLYSNQDRKNREQMNAFQCALAIAGAPTFPEALEFTMSTGYIRYKSRFHKFSSRDVYNSLSHPALGDDCLEQLVEAHIKGVDVPVTGISVTFPDQLFPAFKIAAMIRRVHPDTHITMGGAFVSSHMRRFEERKLYEVVDSFILDEGEVPLEMLLRRLDSGNRDMSDIPGILLARDGKCSRTLSRHASADPLPFPDYSLLPLDQYLIKPQSMALLYRLSHGCYWARCAFCRTQLSFIHDFIQSPPEEIFTHLKQTVETTDVRIYHFSDNAAALKPLEALSRMLIDHGPAIQWVVNLRFSKALDIGQVNCFKKAGCRHVYLGLESLHPRVLKCMNKGITPQWVQNNLALFRKAGIPVTVYMIVGFPTETEAEARESFEQIKALKDDGVITHCVYNVFELAHHSDIHMHPERYGLPSLQADPALDMYPPDSMQEFPGMTRLRAHALCREFIMALRGDSDFVSKDNPCTVSIGGKTRVLHYDISGIEEELAKLESPPPIKFSDMKKESGPSLVMRNKDRQS